MTKRTTLAAIAAFAMTGALCSPAAAATDDLDRDGLPNAWEVRHRLDPRDPADATRDPDRDGLTNRWEFRLRLTPRAADSDDDGRRDAWEDFDGDRMPNGWELRVRLNPRSASDAGQDPDHDGMVNAREYRLRGDILDEDTDGDG